MAVKTSLQVKTFNPVTNKNVTKTATYSNPNATDAQLNSFAQNFYGGLSANTVNSVIRVDKQNITNAESDTTPEPTGTYASFVVPATSYDVNNGIFAAGLIAKGTPSDAMDEYSTTDIKLTSVTFGTNNNISFGFTTDDTPQTIDTTVNQSIKFNFGSDVKFTNESDSLVSPSTWRAYVLPPETTEGYNALGAQMIMAGNIWEYFAYVLNDEDNNANFTASYNSTTHVFKIEPKEGTTGTVQLILSEPSFGMNWDDSPAISEGTLGHNTTVTYSRNEYPIITMQFSV